jgi:hypothetical protein
VEGCTFHQEAQGIENNMGIMVTNNNKEAQGVENSMGIMVTNNNKELTMRISIVSIMSPLGLLLDIKV